MNSMCAVNGPLPTYIPDQHHALTPPPSKVYSKVSFKEHT